VLSENSVADDFFYAGVAVDIADGEYGESG
jgi:hypothetical protein